MKILNKNNRIFEYRDRIVKLPEEDINIEIYYKKPKFLRQLLGLYSINVNDFIYSRALRFTDFDGRLPSIKSTLKYPGILLEYAFQKISKRFVMKYPKPFLVVDAVDYIKKHIDNRSKVLEVGAGNSTLWFLKNGCNVTSLEHDKEWAEEILKNAKMYNSLRFSNLSIKVCEGQEALKFLKDSTEKYDVILVDSMNFHTSRYESIKILKNRLTKNGILVLDNSDGVVNWKAMDVMRGVKCKKFSGYAYNCPYVSQTTVWHSTDILS